MRIAFVQTYPIYHDLLTTTQWLSLLNRDKWMPALVSALGHDVELWGVDRAPGVHRLHVNPIGDLAVRLFAPSRTGKQTKFHESEALVAYCRSYAPDLCVLKGVDGAVGVRLVRQHLGPAGIPFAFVIGGKFYTGEVPRAAAVFFETEGQRTALVSPRRPWRRPVSARRLIHLPKIVDTERFRPFPDRGKTWDVLSVGRLVEGVKSYDALGSFPPNVSIAVAGSGPALASLRARYPRITWLGHVAHAEMPDIMSRARVLFHTSTREYAPRVLAEAASCGLPAAAFAEAIAGDVLPPACGLRLSQRNFVAQIDRLLSDAERLSDLSKSSRSYAEKQYGITALTEPVQHLFNLLEKDH